MLVLVWHCIWVSLKVLPWLGFSFEIAPLVTCDLFGGFDFHIHMNIVEGSWSYSMRSTSCVLNLPKAGSHAIDWIHMFKNWISLKGVL